MFLKLGTGKFIVCFYFYFHGFMVLQFVWAWFIRFTDFYRAYLNSFGHNLVSFFEFSRLYWILLGFAGFLPSNAERRGEGEEGRGRGRGGTISEPSRRVIFQREKARRGSSRSSSRSSSSSSSSSSSGGGSGSAQRAGIRVRTFSRVAARPRESPASCGSGRPVRCVSLSCRSASVCLPAWVCLRVCVCVCAESGRFGERIEEEEEEERERKKIKIKAPALSSLAVFSSPVRSPCRCALYFLSSAFVWSPNGFASVFLLFCFVFFFVFRFGWNIDDGPYLAPPVEPPCQVDRKKTKIAMPTFEWNATKKKRPPR